MDDLSDINFLAVIEGQDYEKSLQKIGFTQLHFTPLEVLAIIEGVQKRLGKKFTAEEIEQGILKDVLTDDDYDLARVKQDLREDRRRVLSDEARRLFRAEPGLLTAAENEFKNLPPNACLDDLASLLTLDTKNINVEKLGADTIKEQQRINLRFSSNKVAVIPEDRAQRMLTGSMQLLQFSGLLEQQAQHLHRDTMKLQAAAPCGTASTNFLNLMENFYRVDEEEEEGALEDAASFAAFVKQHREEREKEKASMKLSVSKASVERDELSEEEEEEEEYIEDSMSTTSSTMKRKTLKQLKVSVADQEKYPSKCNLKEAELFFPTSASTLHDTAVDAKYIGTTEGLSGYKGLYCCLFEGCDFGAQVRANTLSHIRRVHLGHAVGCRYCPTHTWWQVRTWSDHMTHTHPDVPKYPPQEMSNVPLGSSKGDSEVFISEERFKVEVPTGVSEPPLKKIKEEPSTLLSYSEWEKESWKKEAEKGELYLCAEPKDPFTPHPKAVAIRYRKREATEAEQVASAVVSEDIVTIQEEGQDDEFDG